MDASTKPHSVLQDWVRNLPLMQQTVLMSAIRGCDGMAKLHKAKPLVRWYRRCILLSAFDGRALTDPFEPGGGSFTGPVANLQEAVDYSVAYSSDPIQYAPLTGTKLYEWRCAKMQRVSDNFIDSRDELPAHYTGHLMHAFEIVGYKHPDAGIREFWHDLYVRMVHALHVWPETEAQMDERLGDDFAGWDARSDRSTSCTD